MKHETKQYILVKLEETKWENKQLAERSDISYGHISKLKKGTIEKLYAPKLYRLVMAFEDSFENASKIIYPSLKLKTFKYKPRNEFGTLMMEYETVVNSLEQIASKTSIEETRLTEIYYRNGAPEAWELLLIEMAIGEQPGVLFEKMYGEEFRNKVFANKKKTKK